MLEQSSPRLLDTQGWNEYWNKKNRGGWLYAVIAEFYRKVIIRPTLNHFIRKNFAPKSVLLHAGCGSGQVDADIAKDYRIVGLDISPKALELYKESNPWGQTLHGSIFDIDLPEGTVDGIYNLGVMEHFTEEEIGKILGEFRRVLKPKGRLVLFWPPEYGVSVLFFKFLTRLVLLFTGKNVKFHPDEICRLKSKKHALSLLNRAGFEITEYSFSIRDVWTYSIVTAHKSN